MVEAESLSKCQVGRAITALPVLQAKHHIREMREQALAKSRRGQLIEEIVIRGHDENLRRNRRTGKLVKPAEGRDMAETRARASPIGQDDHGML